MHIYMGHATAEDVKKNILAALEKANLSLSRMLMLGMAQMLIKNHLGL